METKEQEIATNGSHGAPGDAESGSEKARNETVQGNGKKMNQEETLAGSVENSANQEETVKAEAETTQDSLQKELEAAKKEIESLKDSWARERAEFQNYKRRTAQEFSNIKREAVRSMVAGFLNPIDNLDRVGSTTTVTEELKPFVDGVAMILKEFYSVLEKSNVYRFFPQGEPFDPTTMEALSSEEGDQYAEETVVEVYQAGFFLKDNEEKFSLRPARVRIGKPRA